MALYIGGEEVGVNNHIVIDGDDNILVYKFQDLSRVIKEGGELASDAEYEAAEIQLQKIYKNIMEDQV